MRVALQLLRKPHVAVWEYCSYHFIIEGSKAPISISLLVELDWLFILKNEMQNVYISKTIYFLKPKNSKYFHILFRNLYNIDLNF